MLQLELLVAAVLLVGLLFFLLVLGDDDFGALLLFIILHHKTDLRGAVCPLFPPLNLIVVDDCVSLVSSDLGSFVGQHEDVTQMLSIRLVVGNFLQPSHKSRYNLKLRIFGFSIMM